MTPLLKFLKIIRMGETERGGEEKRNGNSNRKMTKKEKTHLNKLRRKKPKCCAQEQQQDRAEMDEIKGIKPGKIVRNQ